MSEDKTPTLCPYCGKRVEPDDRGVVHAVEIREFQTFGGQHFVDGTGGFFHPGCPPGAVGYAERPRPDAKR